MIIFFFLLQKKNYCFSLTYNLSLFLKDWNLSTWQNLRLFVTFAKHLLKIQQYFLIGLFLFKMMLLPSFSFFWKKNSPKVFQSPLFTVKFLILILLHGLLLLFFWLFQLCNDSILRSDLANLKVFDFGDILALVI